MGRMTGILLAVMLVTTGALAQSSEGLKVFISVDMEGITGVANWEDVDRDGKDYDLFRETMTREVNAAIEGAVAAGATDIVVRDSHGSARNLLPELLDRRARLLRDWSGGPMSMMDGLDESFDAVLFVGYHAKAGTPDALLEHTMSSSNILDVSINGVSVPEAGINALIAGYYGVPVVFVAGERALCEQATALLGPVETVAVKQGVGNGALCLHPEIARQRIRAGVEGALRRVGDFEPFTMEAPYTLTITFKNEEKVHQGSYYPGARRTGDWELTVESGDLMEIIRAMNWLI
jgi:D-amino peptidase